MTMSVSKYGSTGIRRHHLVVLSVSIFFFLLNSGLSSATASVTAAEPTTLSSEEEAEGDGRESGRHDINRPDPLRHLKHYHGSYDVRDTHYWASAAFTGVHGYAVAGVWMLCGAGFGLFLLIKRSTGNGRICAGRGAALSSNRWLLATFSVIILFAFLAIVTSSFVLAANRSSLHRTDRVKKSIIGAGKDARRTIRKIIQTMTQMQNLLLPFDPREAVELNITTHRLGKESRAIQQFIKKTDRSIDLAIRTSYIAHLVVVVVNLLLLLAAIVLLSLHWQPWFTMIIIVCWIITAVCWAITGFDFFFHNFAEDTCSAFRDFVQNPENSSLSSILPCVDSAYANQVLVQIGSTVYNFVQQLNMKIAELRNILKPNKQSESLGLVFRVCQPFSGPPDYIYTGNCSEGEIPIGQMPQVLATLTCYKNESSAECARDGKFLSEGAYNVTWAVTTSIEDLLGIYPDLQDLSECSFVKSRLRYVVSHQCKPFRSSLRLLWASMLTLSIFMAVIVLLWVTKAYQDKGKTFSGCSIFPQS